MTKWLYCPECGQKLVSKLGENTGDPHPACPDGHYTHYDNPKPTVGVILTDGKNILLLKRNIEPGKGRWEIPGGFVEGLETLEEAAKREISEETGLAVTRVRYLGSYRQTYGVEQEKLVPAFFVARVENSQVNLSAENSEYRWVDPADLPSDMAFESEAQAIADYTNEAT